MQLVGVMHKYVCEFVLPVQSCWATIRHHHMGIHAQRSAPLLQRPQGRLCPVDTFEEAHMVRLRECLGPVGGIRAFTCRGGA
jgi:hypothetical protein